MGTEHEDLLNTPIDSVDDVTSKPHQIDLMGDKQRYLANPASQYEVSVAGIAVSGPKEENDFDKTLKLYDKCLRQHDTEVVVTHILNGVRTVILRSPVVKVKAKPHNPIGISWEDET